MKLAVVCAAGAIVIALGATGCGASKPAGPIVFAANRAPTTSGEIYRLDPNGHRVDLSNSPFQDTSPVVSPDGKRVAFLSDRLGGIAIYEVDIDGRNLTLLAHIPDQLYGQPPDGEIYWQPHGDRVAFANGGAVTIAEPSHPAVDVTGASFATSASPWSPDGKVLALWKGERVQGVSADGRMLWTVGAKGSFGSVSGAWSSHGLLAIAVAGGVAVYDEQGQQVFEYPGASELSWSPDGRLLALTARAATVVLTAAGTRVLSTSHAFGSWVDSRHLVFSARRNCKFVDVRTGGVTTGGCGNRFGSAAFAFALPPPLSPNRKLAIVAAQTRHGEYTLGVAPAGGGAMTAYTHVPGCATGNGGVEWTPAVSSLQIAPRTDSIVYEDWGLSTCSTPPTGDLYEVEPDGSGLKRLTHGADATQASVSPDGTKIAYVLDTGQACAARIMVANSSGTRLHTYSAWDDEVDSPTWSPDGKTILYSGWYMCGGANFGKLFTLPAAGGKTRYLGVGSHANNLEPAWGPTRIAFIGDHGLVTANPDGSDRTLVAKDGDYPAWSPSGQLAYLVWRGHVPMLVVGSTQANLPFAQVGALHWTPDGTRLEVIASMRKYGTLDLYTVKPDGTGLVRLTKNFGVLAGSPIS